jgi:predicted NAD/FAD-binding protein
VTRRRIAVVGAGIAGLTAAYVLQRDADVTLYEADDRLGGHAHTHDVPAAGGHTLSLDTGFIVHNERTYPTLRRLFAELNVRTQESEMSMSVSCGECGLEYAGGRGLSGLIPSFGTILNLRYLRMLREVVTFHRQARQMLAGEDESETLSQFLHRGGFSQYFVSHFVTPLISAVWSCAPDQSGEYPARYLFVFLANHGALSVKGSPNWQTVVGGSARYVEKITKGLTAIETSTPVRSISRIANGVQVRDDTDAVADFDGVVIATHPDQALRLLSTPTRDETELLGAIGYTVNPTLLHSDPSVLPHRERAQASWNYYLPACRASASRVHVSYNLNRLQRLDTDTPYIVTLNGDDVVAPDRVMARMVYSHPVYTAESVAARRRLPSLNDATVAFAGAYHGWGFHEDGCRSGLAAAQSLGGEW